MPGEPDIRQLLAAVISLLARTHFPEEQLRRLVAPTPSHAKYMKAYNLCDGTRTRGEIAKAVGLDKDNFSKVVNRWIQDGILFEIGPGRSTRLLHLYSLPKDSQPARRKSHREP